MDGDMEHSRDTFGTKDEIVIWDIGTAGFGVLLIALGHDFLICTSRR